MNKRLISVFLTLCLVFGMLPLTALPAHADEECMLFGHAWDVDYILWDPEPGEVVSPYGYPTCYVNFYCTRCQERADAMATFQSETEHSASTCATNGRVTYYYYAQQDDFEVFPNEVFLLPLNPTMHENLEHVDAVEPAPGVAGNIEFWHCTGCDKYFEDDYGDFEISQAETVLAALPTTWAELQTQINNAPDGTQTTITLTQDAVSAASDTTLTVPAGKSIVLDLNGHGLRASFTGSSLISVPSGATLTLNDSAPSAAHRYTLAADGLATVNDAATGTEGTDYYTFTGGYVTGADGSQDGGAFYVRGTVNMNAGTVLGNHAGAGGCAYVNGGTFNLSGGTVLGNTVSSSGGGVRLAYSGVLNMSGGAITKNAAGQWGGGVYTPSTQSPSVVNLTGGAITQNVCCSSNGSYGNGGGIQISSGSKLYVSGNPVVSGNRRGTDANATDNNIFLNSEQLHVNGALTSGASLGVTVTNVSGSFVSSSDPSYAAADKFFSDNVSYAVSMIGNELQLVAAGLLGSGTEADPYQIWSSNAWDAFASNVNGGNSYAGEYVRLCADISVTTVVGVTGSDYKAFSGVFDGDGHTLNVTLSDSANQGTAPFREILGATIKNLTVTGTVQGTTHAAGLVGFSRGASEAAPNRIENCVVSTDVAVVTASGNRHMGGVVGHGLQSWLVIKDTVFNGTMTNTGNYAGGLQGWSDGNHLTVENSFFVGSYNGNAAFHPIAIQNHGSTGTYVNNGAYYTATPSSYITADYVAGSGTQVLTTVPAIASKTDLTAADGNTYYLLTGFTLHNAADWDVFAQSVNDGAGASGLSVRLADDFDNSASPITTMAGTEKMPFRGSFDGNGKTLYVNLETTEQYCAPFRYVENASFGYLRTTGTIRVERKDAGGIISLANGTVRLTACRSSVDIISSVDGDGTHGGLVAASNNSITFVNCLFDGSISGSDTSCCGGFLGWRNNSVEFTNCLMAGTMNVDSSDSATFSRNPGVTLRNCYYRTSFGDVQGTAVGDRTDAELAAALGQAWSVEADGVIPIPDEHDLRLTTVTGVDYFHLYTGSELAITPVVTAPDGTVLTENSDYTLSFSPSPVQAKGEYTLTITGAGDYNGTLTYTFLVSDAIPVTADTTEFADGYYYVADSDVTVTGRIAVNGAATLLLNDGVTLTLPKGIQVLAGNSLTIEGPGALVANAEQGNAGIGGNYNAASCGTVVINGGTVTATGGSYGAGIGGGRFSQDGVIVINGGTVTATGGTHAAGIGGGGNVNWAGHYGIVRSVTITGGTVVAQGDGNGAGIGGGGTSFPNAGGGNVLEGITITGGRVTASSGSGYGIGPGINTVTSGYDGSVGELVTFGWTEESDYIQSSRNVGADKLAFASGKAFVIDGEKVVATESNIQSGCRLIPKVAAMDLDLSYAVVSGVEESYWYTGAEISVTPSLTDISGNPLSAGSDYTTELSYNGSPASAVEGSGAYTLTFTGTGSYSGTKTVSFAVTVPATPTDLQAGDYFAGSMTLTWQETGAATAWVLEYSPNGDFSGASSEDVSGTPSLPLTELPDRTTLYFRVKSVINGLSSAWSSPINLYTKEPGCVGLTSAPSAGSAELSWDPNGGYTSWVVEYCADGSFSTDVYSMDVSGNPSCMLQGLTNEIIWYARVKNVSGVRESDWSTVARFIPSAKIVIRDNGTGWKTTLPLCTFNKASLSEQLYSSAELGAAGRITGIDFLPVDAIIDTTVTRNLDVYLLNTDKQSFSASNDWVIVSESDRVFRGNVTFTVGDWCTISFDEPFDYDGSSNLLLVVDDNTGDYSNGWSFRTVNGGYGSAICTYDDFTDFDPTQSSVAQAQSDILTERNAIRLGISYPVTVDPGVLGGTVSADREFCATGERVTLTATPAENFVFDSFTVTRSNGQTVTVTDGSFLMPDGGVTVSASFHPTAAPYVDAAGSARTPVTSFTAIDENMTTLTEGWWIVFGDLTNTNRLIVQGDVNLILFDGSQLTAPNGVKVAEGNSLTVWAQSHGSSAGALTVTGPSGDCAGIGSDQSENSGAIVINGGVLNVTSTSYGAGIGGGMNGSGTVTINGGSVTAVNTGFGAGIGGGRNGVGTVTINGGTVNAQSDTGSAAIGGGSWQPGYVTITGGTVTAVANPSGGGVAGAGIGDGYRPGTAGTVVINGGTVTTSAGYGGAGIGGGMDNVGNVTINGGAVSATGGDYAPGIGGSSGSTVTLNWVEETMAAMSVTANSYGGTVILQKDFSDQSGTVYTATSSADAGALAGKTLTPYVPPVPYVDAVGTAMTPVTNYRVVYSSTGTLTAGWWIVDQSFTNNRRLTVDGDVNLILCETKTLTVPLGINVPEGSSLTIWAQSQSGSAGALTALEAPDYCAAIGGDMNQNSGEIVVNGGVLNVRSTSLGAAIGGGMNGSGTVTVNAGTVDAVNTNNGAAIGGGRNGVGTVTINGGTVTAHSDTGSAAIGGGSWQPGYVTITGGTVEAVANSIVGGATGAGIGNGYGSGTAGSVEITGGTVMAGAGYSGAVIGGAGGPGNVTITGGTVIAAGGMHCAGIGGGTDNSTPIDASTVTISGGLIHAIAGSGAEAIGSGNNSSEAAITVTGGLFTEDSIPASYAALPSEAGDPSGYYRIGPVTVLIGTAGYATLGTALAGAEDGDTIVLLTDVVWDGGDLQFPGKALTLDLNGQTISNVGIFWVTVENVSGTYCFGTLTVTDSSAAAGAVECEEIWATARTSLTLERGTFRPADPTANLIVKPGGTTSFGATFTVTGEAVLDGNVYNNSYLPVTISGSAAVEGSLSAGSDASYQLSGGYYRTEPDAAWVSTGCELLTPAESDRTGYYQVVPGRVAQVGQTKYATFAEAVTAAGGVETITLLDNIPDAYTMSVGETLLVIKDGHTLTVEAPSGNYVVHAEDSTETVGTEPDVTTITTTTYTVFPAVAKVGDALYGSFAEAATAAAGVSRITLLENIADAYTMAADETLLVIKDGHTLTVNPPAGNYVIQAVDTDETVGEDPNTVTITTTTYTVIPAVAKVGDVLYGSFAEAATAAAGVSRITLLDNIADAYTMAADETLLVIKDGYTLTVEAPAGSYAIHAEDSTETVGTEPDVTTITTTTYTVVPAVAKVGDVLYGSFAEAATAAAGVSRITLLDDIADAYTMAADETLVVIKDGHTLTVDPPAGDWYVNAAESTETVGEEPNVTTITITTYTVAGAEAETGGVAYRTFAEAAAAANGVVITLLTNVASPYDLQTNTIQVRKGSFTLTVTESDPTYWIDSAEAEGITTYTPVRYSAYMDLNGVRHYYTMFADAVAEAGEDDMICMLRDCVWGNDFDIAQSIYSYKMTGPTQTFRVNTNGFELDIREPDDTAEDQWAVVYDPIPSTNVIATRRGYTSQQLIVRAAKAAWQFVQSKRHCATLEDAVARGYAGAELQALIPMNGVAAGTSITITLDSDEKFILFCGGVAIFTAIVTNLAIELTPKAHPIKFVLTLNGGTADADYMRGEWKGDNGKVETPITPTKTGSEFAGWYYDSSFSAEFDMTKTIDTDVMKHTRKCSDDSYDYEVDLYAKWDLHLCEVGGTYYDSFPEAVSHANTYSGANASVITLYGSVSDSFELGNGQTLKVRKNGNALTVTAAAGLALSTRTEEDVTVWVAGDPVASVNETPYLTFQEAAEAANGANITLHANITTPYTLGVNETIHVFHLGYSLTVNPPEGDYVVSVTTTTVTYGTTRVPLTTYQAVPAVAKVDGTCYGSFAEAAAAAAATMPAAKITLLANITDAYTMAADETLLVIRDGHTMTVNPPDGNYVVFAEDSTETVGTEPDVTTITTTTYTVIPAVAKVGDALCGSFAEAATAAAASTPAAKITLLANIADAYTMAADETLLVILDGHTLTVNPPDGNYVVSAVDSTETIGTEPDVTTITTTTYTVIPAVAKVGDALCGSFTEAATAASGVSKITLLANITDAYTMAADETLLVIKDGHTLTVNPPAGDYVVSAVDSTETIGTEPDVTTITTTTYTVHGAVAKVSDTPYDSFAEAASAAAGANYVTLLTDIGTAYVMTVGETLKVIRNGHALPVDPPMGHYLVHAEERLETVGTQPNETTVTVTTYTVQVAVAEAGGVRYASFPAAVSAAGGTTVTLLENIAEPYTLAVGQTIRVLLGGHSLTVNLPDANCRLDSSADGDVSVYTAVAYYAQVGSSKYESFAAAAADANGVEEITLLRDMNSAFSMNSVNYEILRVVKDGHTANITDYVTSKDRGSVTYYYKTEASSGCSGSGFAFIAGGLFVAAGTAAILYLDEYGGGAATGVVLAEGASITVEGGDIDVSPENPENQCIQQTEESGSTTYTNLKFTWVTVDTGITIMDAASSILPDCVNDIWADYNQNTASIVTIAPPVLTVVGFTDIKISFPYPEGWVFPPIPHLPDAMNPGNHFAGFFRDATVGTYGIPWIGGVVTEPLEIGALWIPCEAAVVLPDGSKDYYLAFTDAAAAANGNVVEILHAPLASYTLQKTSEDPLIYETLKLNRGFYTGSCVSAPDGLPSGYGLRSWTYQSGSDTITCYTVDKANTVTFVYNNGTANTTETVYTNQTCTKPTDPTLANYSFTGWYTDTACTQLFNFATPIYADQTLYAGWSAVYTIAGTSLTLEGDIGINFYVDLHGAEKQDVSMTLRWDGHDTVTVPFSTLEPIPAGQQHTGLYKVTVRVAAKEMADAITAELRHGDTVVASGETSVESYALSIWKNEGGVYNSLFTGQSAAQRLQELQGLCRSMLIYGAKAQTLFKYETGAPADRGLDAADKVLSPLEQSELAGLGGVTFDETALAACGLRFYGMSLVLESETTLRVYFKVIDADLYAKTEVRLNGQKLTAKPNVGYIYFDISNIAAKNVLNDFTLNIGSTAGGSFVSTTEASFNAGAYIGRALAEEDEATQNAVTGLYRYCKAAVAYFPAS